MISAVFINHSGRLNYSRVEIAATKKKKGDSPLFYILIIMALKKMKDEKRGLSPFFYARRVKNADRKKEIKKGDTT